MSWKFPRAVALAAVVTIALGCQTERPEPAASAPSLRPDALVLNTSPPVIGNRYRMDPSDIELAVLLAIGTPREVPAMKPAQKISDDLLPTIIGRGSHRGWSYRSREPGVIYADFEQGRVFMNVAIMFDSDLVMLRILDSRNLGQEGDRIRQSAFTYLAPLENRIRMNIEAVAQRNWYGTPVPANQ
jgi:hypothetical protein